MTFQSKIKNITNDEVNIRDIYAGAFMAAQIAAGHKIDIRPDLGKNEALISYQLAETMLLVRREALKSDITEQE